MIGGCQRCAAGCAEPITLSHLIPSVLTIFALQALLYRARHVSIYRVPPAVKD